jgi:hypothetical protein
MKEKKKITFEMKLSLNNLLSLRAMAQHAVMECHHYDKVGGGCCKIGKTKKNCFERRLFVKCERSRGSFEEGEE